MSFISSASFTPPPSILPFTTTAKIPKPSSPILLLTRHFCSSSDIPTTEKLNPKLSNFSIPSDSESNSETTAIEEVNPPELPKNPFIEEPVKRLKLEDIQQILAEMVEDEFFTFGVKMVAGLVEDGFFDQVVAICEQMAGNGPVPDVLTHTGVMEACVNVGDTKQAHDVYLEIIAKGVNPNAYTYRVLIKALAESRDVEMVKDAKKYVEVMVEKGMIPNCEVCVQVLEELEKMGLKEEHREMMKMLKEKVFEMCKAKGVVSEEDFKFTNVLKYKIGGAYRNLTSVFNGKWKL